MRGDRSTWVLVGVLAMGALAGFVFMRPTLAAPIAGDDRALYPSMGADTSWTPLSDLADLPNTWESRTQSGRVNLLSPLERRTAARVIIETSMATNAPTYLVNSLVKLLLTLISVLTLTALVKSLRWRGQGGALVSLSGRTVLLCTLAGGLLFVLGSQPQYLGTNGSNGWVNYPTHTYGAVVSIFGVVALVLWLARLYAEGRHRVTIVLTLIMLAVLTNFRYELVFPAVPLAVIALLLVPVTSRDRAAEGRRAKWVTGLAYAGAFLPILLVLRWYLGSVCEAGTCYSGVTPSLSGELLRTFWLNLISGLPGAASEQATTYVEWSGMSGAGMHTPTLASVLVAGAMASALLAGWWLTRPRERAALSATPPAAVGDIASERDEASMLAVGAALCLLGSLGAATVMSLSEAAQEGMKLGMLYRHTVVAWAGMAWTLVLGVLAIGSWRPRPGAAAWLALTAAATILAAFLLPANERSLEADRVVNTATTTAFAELVRGDLSADANDDRCRLLPAIVLEPNFRGGGPNIVEAFDQAFRRYWGQGFCA